MAGANDPRFADVERQYYALKAQLSGGQLSREQFEAALQKLMILDAQSRYWMMGAETGKWYVYDGQNWGQGEPPTSAAPASPPVSSAASTAATQSDSATLAAFTPPAAAAALAGGPVTPDAAPTRTFTPAGVEPPGPVSANAAPTIAFTPAAKTGGAAQPESAPTMAFTPAASNKPALDKAATVAAFSPPRIATGGTTPSARTVPAAAAGGRRLSPVLVLVCLFALACLSGIVVLAFAVNSRFGGAPAPLSTVAAAAATATATTAATSATETPAPANTSAPAATAPPAPTRTPLPPPSNTPAPQPQFTPPIVIPATATATQTPQTATDTPGPTATDTSVPAPTRTPRPVVEFPVSFSYVGYEKWGRPSSDCTQFNNKDAVRQFKWEELVTNKTATAVAGADWGMPAVTNNEGTQVPVCAYVNPTIQPGQAGKTTYAAYVALNQFVQRIVHQIRNTTYIRCLDSSAKEVSC
jgi:hypothetical protein